MFCFYKAILSESLLSDNTLVLKNVWYTGLVEIGDARVNTTFWKNAFLAHASVAYGNVFKPASRV